MTTGRKNYFKLFNSGLLLVPGFFNAVLALLLSSNRLFPDKVHITLLLLNISQLLSFGITVSKYAADQMILSKLNQNERAALTPFFLKRVLPLALLFSIFLFYSNDLLTAATLLICIPVEVFVIIVVLELNVSGRYFTSLKINLLGYPLIFAAFIICSKFIHLQQYQILIIFISSSLLRLLAAVYYRKGKVIKQDEGVLVTSPHVPLQQAGNYLLFKADQVIIASNLLQTSFLKIPLPGDYLFYSKFSEVFSGIATAFGPLLAKVKDSATGEISLKPLLQKRFFLLLNIIAVLFRIIISLVLLRTLDSLHILMLLPFSVATLLIIPVNMLNYEFYRRNEIGAVNWNNGIAFFVTGVLLFINCFVKSAFLFAWIVPVQLMVFILFSLHMKSRKNYA